MTTVPLAVEMRGISKSFGGIPVLRDVDLRVRPGEVHALVGENGAGKSTLMKILHGVYSADSGQIFIDGTEVQMSDTLSARAAGIGMVFQEFSLVPTLSVAQNIYLTSEPTRARLIDDRRAEEQARDVLTDMGVALNPRAPLGQLGTAQWQLVEIAKALAQRVRVLIMDEPTASLAKHEADRLFELLRRLRSVGVAIVYISHRMDEIYRIADRITALRDGRAVISAPISEVSAAQVVQAIVGREMSGEMAWRPRESEPSEEPIFEVRDLTAGPRVRGVSFEVRAGEIVGIAGLMGSGRSELLRSLFGIDRAASGEIVVRGQRARIRTPKDAMRYGLALIPEDRRAQGLVLHHSVGSNLLLPLLDRIQSRGLIDTQRSRSLVSELIQKFAIKARHSGVEAVTLSGGNQQKIVIAKWLGTSPAVLMMDEPTAGVDIGTKVEIMEMVREIADEGRAVLFVSSELPELLAVSDRILVLRDGVVVRNIPRAELRDQESLQVEIQGV